MHNIDRTLSAEERDFEERDFEERDFEERDFEERDFEERDFEERDFEERDFEERDFEERDFESGTYESGTYESGTYESPYQGEAQGLTGLSQDREVNLAAELLTVQNEASLDAIIRKIVGDMRRARRGFLRKPVSRVLGGLLKGVVKRALPMVGNASDSATLPGIGPAIGGQLTQAASKLFEVNLERLSDEQAQFEVAQRWVRLAADAARRAAQVADSPDPRQAARKSLAAAAQVHAPGLARAISGSSNGVGSDAFGGITGMEPRGWPRGRPTGRWVRRGKYIILLGV